MRIKTLMGTIINVDRIKRSITVSKTTRLFQQQ